jgi:hypothetical protein
MKSLLSKIEDCIKMGYIISFESDANHFAVRLIKDSNGEKFSAASFMPFENHFNEEKVIKSISWMEDKIEEEIKAFQNQIAK